MGFSWSLHIPLPDTSPDLLGDHTYLLSLDTCQLLPRLVESGSSTPSGFRKSSDAIPLKFPHMPHTFCPKVLGSVTSTRWFPSNFTFKPKSVVTTV